jgi:hypothetical protein
MVWGLDAVRVLESTVQVCCGREHSSETEGVEENTMAPMMAKTVPAVTAR